MKWDSLPVVITDVCKKKPYNLIRCTLDILNDKITVLQNRRTITAVKMTVRSKKKCGQDERKHRK